MKRFYLSAMAFIALCVTLTAGENLLPGQWWPYGKAASGIERSAQGGVLSFKNTTPLDNGFSSAVKLPPNQFKEIKVGCEVKAKQVQAKNLDGNFCLYMDIELANGKMVYGNKIMFKAGTFDWSKQSQVFKFDQTIKNVNFYILFRQLTGEAQVRNIFFEAVK